MHRPFPCGTTAALALSLTLAACSDSNTSNSDGGTIADQASGTPSECAGLSTHIAKAVCAANNLLTVLPSAQKASVNLAFTANTDRTKWSNLPTGMVARAGVAMNQLDSASQTAALGARCRKDLRGELGAEVGEELGGECFCGGKQGAQG